MSHTCRCTSCYDFHLSKGPISPEHVALRFRVPVRADIRVLLDGKDVTLDCIEALPGPEGYIVSYPLDDYGVRHYCRHCYRRVCTAVRKGNVEVSYGEVGGL